MTEHDTIKNIIDYGFTLKSQLKSQKTVMLQSIISIMIMECEDILAEIDELDDMDTTAGSPDSDV
jgi:hypothetical protein